MHGVGPRRHNSLSRLSGIALTAIGLIGGAAMIGAGQTADIPDQTSRKVRLRGGDDPNVTGKTEINVRPKPTGDPGKSGDPRKSADPPRPTCTVTFDNKTTLYTKAYIDGVYAGTVSPRGGLSVPAAPGSTMLYARAEYDDGSADGWGPVRIGCQTKYTWRLTD